MNLHDFSDPSGKFMGCNLCQRTELKVPQQALKTITCSLKIQIVAKSCRSSDSQSRLLGIKLPWMQVKNQRQPIPGVKPTDRFPGSNIGQKSEVSTTPYWKVNAQESDGRNRKLEQFSFLFQL
jgi:hypothetical protein